MQDELTTAIYAARAGGAIIHSLFGQNLAAREKRSADLVTEADQAAEVTILAVLRAAHPDFGIISEECGALPGTAGSEYTWVVDPLDGTNNFVAGIPQVGVSIALVRGKEAVLGVVYQPMVDVLWQARRGEGARRNGRPIAAAARQDNLGRATVAYVQGYLAGDALALATQRALYGRVKRVLTNWAAALDWCLLAEGRIAAVVSLDSEWEDQVAGALIAQEAGARVTNLAGHPYAPGMTRLLACGNDHIHAALSHLLRDITP